MALPTQAEMLDKAASEQRLIRAAIGMKNRHEGNMFDQWILRGYDWYWEKGIAYIEKTPEPMHPIKVYGDRRRGQFRSRKSWLQAFQTG